MNLRGGCPTIIGMNTTSPRKPSSTNATEEDRAVVVPSLSLMDRALMPRPAGMTCARSLTPHRWVVERSVHTTCSAA